MEQNEIDKLISSTLETYKSKIPGLAVGIFKDGELEFFKGYGYADIEKKKEILLYLLIKSPYK